ncbi:MAG: glutamyl-tRNA amidotransferase [Candidatus Vogelbacteria bacterium CG10_big_fil_rev_8_21_14_0_10_51_16]|uniref:Glutamyl-tRNA amidotransferase n=1 Tax=Candidatus Vogelbacteria bacterium CG10_big_fil_rev_8_21_14_0_10_51_16 TaxID=1975045 RepID=A0A2H0REB1_9BACT|nr:MAG: glutamyl-tRNA amidotransferase [Candidatus Vogelbacteria bacterium CG10_big_fil_rev_8_21_14_0_10_51_16]
MIQDDIRNEIKQAMLAKEETRLSVLRGLLAAFVNELVATKRKPDELLSDEEALGVIRRQVKQRKDSIEQYTKGKRPDLAEAEQAELELLEAYLPKIMSRDEIRPIAEAKLAEMGALDKSKSGILVGAIMKELKGKADGGDVKAVAEELLA